MIPLNMNADVKANIKAIFWDAEGVVLRSSRLFSEQLEIDYGIKTEILQPFFTGIFRQCT